MSTLRPEADIWAGLQHVCFVQPTSDMLLSRLNWRSHAADAGNHRPPFVSEGPPYLLASLSFARTSSILKVDGFCRCGYSLNVARN
jgi:hypothetical protein